MHWLGCCDMDQGSVALARFRGWWLDCEMAQSSLHPYHTACATGHSGGRLAARPNSKSGRTGCRCCCHRPMSQEAASAHSCDRMSTCLWKSQTINARESQSNQKVNQKKFVGIRVQGDWLTVPEMADTRKQGDWLTVPPELTLGHKKRGAIF